MHEVSTHKGSIGFFDSSSGGLTVLRAVRAAMPEYSYVYFADTANAPYGPKSQAEVRALTERAVRYLFSLGCELVILACNTASATALRDIQRRVLPNEFPDKRVLGVIVPTIEEIISRPREHAGIIATQSTIDSHVYDIELKKRDGHVQVTEFAAPELATLIESGAVERAIQVINDAVRALQQSGCTTIVLGCTHYALIKEHIAVENVARIISQDDIIPVRLKDYIARHPEIFSRLTRDASVHCYLSAPHAFTTGRINDWFPHCHVSVDNSTSG